MNRENNDATGAALHSHKLTTVTYTEMTPTKSDFLPVQLDIMSALFLTRPNSSKPLIAIEWPKCVIVRRRISLTSISRFLNLGRIQRLRAAMRSHLRHRHGFTRDTSGIARPTKDDTSHFTRDKTQIRKEVFWFCCHNEVQHGPFRKQVPACIFCHYSHCRHCTAEAIEINELQNEDRYLDLEARKVTSFQHRNAQVSHLRTKHSEHAEGQFPQSAKHDGDGIYT